MTFFRVLPEQLRNLSDDFLDFFFIFANTYTESSVLSGYIKETGEKQKEATADELRELGYSEKDILEMDV